MIKRAAGMIVASALLCGAVAAVTTNDVPHPEEDVITQLKPNTEEISYTIQQSIGVPRTIGIKDGLTPATDYGQIFPYAAGLIGWDAEGEPMYRYALADSAGECITTPVYTSVERMNCQNNLIWVMHEQGENGADRVSCAAQDGSWMLGPFDGTIRVMDTNIFLERKDSTHTIVYDSNGKIIGQVAGRVTSCSDGIIVSYEGTSGPWHISSASTAKEFAVVQAKHVGRFFNDSATVQITDTLWGFCDKKGKITTTTASWIEDCYAGYALAKDANKRYGVLSTSGKEIAPYEYVNGVHCSDTLPIYQLWTDEQECMVLSAKSNQKLMLPEDLQAQTLIALPENHFAYVNENGNTSIFDDLNDTELTGNAGFYQQGRYIVAAYDEGCQLFSMDQNKAGKLLDYNYILPPHEAGHEDTVFTAEDPATGLQGIADTNGKLVLDMEYDRIFSIDGSYFFAVQNGWSGIVDANGDWIVRTFLTGMQ